MLTKFEVMKKRMLHAIGSSRAVAVTYDPKSGSGP